MPAPASGSTGSIEGKHMVNEKLGPQDLSEQIHHLRMVGSDVEDELIVGEGEVLGHHPLPLASIGNEGRVEQAMLIHEVT